MLRRRGISLLVGICLGLASLSGFLGGSSAQAGLPGQTTPDITFPETGTTLSDAYGFLSYWQAHGGLAQFGYPLTPEAIEVSPTNGRVYITQWFERNRFEYHPENADPEYKVLLSLLGNTLSKGRENEAPFRRVQDPHNDECLYFPQTGHSLCFSFRKYWEQHGGLALYGYPISEELAEKNQTDGKTYTVQYFERNRFEYHPENKGTQYEVLLGLLGTQLGGFPIPPLPTANTPTTLQVPAKLNTGDNIKWATEHTLNGPPGMKINLFGLGPALRMIAIAPNGDLFVSSKTDGKVFVMPDRNGDGVADDTKVFVEGLSKPHGLAFHNGFLYVACEAAVIRYPYAAGQMQAAGPGQKIADLPFGQSQGLVKDVNHDTRSITFGQNNKMYISIGSDCDACEVGDPRRAAIMQFNDDGSDGHIYATGLRNAVGLDVDPRTGLLWASVNERNSRGNDIPPDMLTPIHNGDDYGWPYCMGIPLQPDPQFGKSAQFCSSKTTGVVGLPAHIAPLGIRFYNGGAQMPHAYDYGIFLAMHGSMLHDPPYGYDVRFVSLRPARMVQGAQIAISGWFVEGKYWGRPVDLAFGRDGAMYISDDAAGAVYRVTMPVK